MLSMEKTMAIKVISELKSVSRRQIFLVCVPGVLMEFFIVW